ncbi:hypothetical protein BC830DRAFT_399677 [Chytriomyces sp. MP71]|nr:hypothetical protein BC830DRAFT_399677 [Chytriomyces sp. MP71]
MMVLLCIVWVLRERMSAWVPRLEASQLETKMVEALEALMAIPLTQLSYSQRVKIYVVTVIMEPLAFLPAHVRQLVLSDSQDHQLPQSVEDDGFVAIIDISGYSKLSSRLESLLGNEAGATIKDLINPPMEIIIKSVNHHKGSVVKLAGDAVIASWSLHTGAAEFGRESMTLQYQLLGSDVLLCCLKLLEAFRDYTISFEVKQGSSFDENVFNKHPHNSKDNARSPDRSGKPAPWFKSAASKFGLHANEKISQPLKIHIGIGIGRFNHIHIGNKMKREYFIAGPSLEQSGICLNLGKQGDLPQSLKRRTLSFLNPMKLRLGG